jgi:hypothetical protein
MWLNQMPGLEFAQSSFEGVLRLSAPSSISVVGARLRCNERGECLISMMPPTNENAPPLTESLFFPYVVNSTDRTTQLNIYSGQAGQASSGTVRFVLQSGQIWLR